MNDDDLVPRERVVTMQIICASLMMGIISFLGVGLFLVLNREPPPADRVPIVSYIAIGMLFMNTCLALMVPHFMARAAVMRLGSANTDRHTCASHLLAVRQSALIVAWALFEGAAMTAGVGFLVEAYYPVLGVIVVALVMMALLFPSHGSLDAWLRRQLSQVEEVNTSISESNSTPP